MKVKELIEMLEQQDPDAEVRLAFQPSYPMEYAVLGIAATEDLEECFEPKDEVNQVVYLAEGGWIGYGRREVWRAARRR